MKPRTILWLAAPLLVACDAAAPTPQDAPDTPDDPMVTASQYFTPRYLENWAKRDFCKEEEERERAIAAIEADPSHPANPIQLARKHAERVTKIRADPSHPLHSIGHELSLEYKEVEMEPKPWLSYCKNPRPPDHMEGLFRTKRITRDELDEHYERIRIEWEAKQGPALRGAK